MTVNGAALVQDMDYTVSWSNNVNVGKAEVHITGRNNYQGTLTCSFMIEKGFAPQPEEIMAYTVTFDFLGHGTGIQKITGVGAGSLIEEPAPPAAAGYRFMGWYQDRAFTKIWDFDTDTVHGDMVLYARWLAAVSGDGDADSDLYIGEIPSQTYTGSAIRPSVVIYASDGDAPLKAGKDYTVQYYNNINASEMNAIKINAVGTDVVKTVSGGVSRTGEEDNGFSSSLPYVAITGKGNYKGTIYRNFQISAVTLTDNGRDLAAGFVLSYTEQLAGNSKKSKKPFTSLKYKKPMKAGADYLVTLTAQEAYGKNGDSLPGNMELAKEGGIPVIPAGCWGTFQIAVTGINNYRGTLYKTIYVADKSHLMKNATITIGKNLKSIKYSDGKDIVLTPAYYDASTKGYYAVDENGMENRNKKLDKADAFVVKSGKTGLRYGKDFTVSYTDNRAVGTATLTITGIGMYVGAKRATFRITGDAFSAKTIDVDGFHASMPYTGKALTQNGVMLSAGSTKLAYGKDYTVRYGNNVKKGTAAMVFTANPASGYSGSFKKTFKILPAALDKDAITITASDYAVTDGNTRLEGETAYTKAGAKPSGRVQLVNGAGVMLKEGRDYVLRYGANVAAGRDKGSITVTGAGLYGGSVTVRFPIESRSLILK